MEPDMLTLGNGHGGRFIIMDHLTIHAHVQPSGIGVFCHHAVESPEISYIPAVREDVAMGVASAAYFTGGLGGIMMQNSGVGNVVNALTSFNLMYKIPVLMIIGWRGYGGPPNDAPEHWIMGTKTPEILDVLGVPYSVLESDNLDSALDGVLEEMNNLSTPGALLVRAGMIG